VFTYLFIDLFHFVFVFVISFVFVFWFIFTVEEDTAPWRADRLGPGRSKLGIERWTRPARDIFRDGHRPAFYNAPIRLFSKLGTKADECGQPPLRLGIGCGLGACVKCEPGRWWRHDAGGEERGQLTEDGCIDPNGIIGGGAPRCGGAILLAAPLPSSAFSSSRRFKQAAFGFRFLSRTCCSSCMMTSTAMLRMPSLVCGLSDFKCVMHMRPNSLSASLISRIRILSLALLACRLSFSLTTFTSGSASSSSSSLPALLAKPPQTRGENKQQQKDSPLIRVIHSRATIKSNGFNSVGGCNGGRGRER